jgi:hypothetical protein
MSILKRSFWAAALDRAVRSAAQAALLGFGADQFNVMQANWHNLLGFAGGGFVLSILNSLAIRPPETPGGQSLSPVADDRRP